MQASYPFYLGIIFFEKFKMADIIWRLEMSNLINFYKPGFWLKFGAQTLSLIFFSNPCPRTLHSVALTAAPTIESKIWAKLWLQELFYLSEQSGLNYACIVMYTWIINKTNNTPNVTLNNSQKVSLHSWHMNLINIYLHTLFVFNQETYIFNYK